MRIMTVVSGALLTSIAVSGAVFANDTYRSGQPEVLAPPLRHVADVLAPLRNLAASIRRKGSPRIAIYWGRTLGKEVGSQYQRVRESSVSAEVDNQSAVWRTRHGVAASGSATASGTHRTVEREERLDEDTSTPLERAKDWELEAAVADRLGGAGLRLVDPDLVRRRAGAAKGADTRDVAGLEMKGLDQYADYVLEIAGRGSASESGWEFRVTLKQVKSGRRMFDLTTMATPPIGTRERVVASAEGGFQRVRDEATVGEVADQLASEIARKLDVALF